MLKGQVKLSLPCHRIGHEIRLNFDSLKSASTPICRSLPRRPPLSFPILFRLGECKNEFHSTQHFDRRAEILSDQPSECFYH